MPLYKLHEAPRVGPTFERPAADDPNRMEIDEDSNGNTNGNGNSPSGAANHAQQSPPAPSRVLSSSSMQQQQQQSPYHASRAVGIAPHPPQHELQQSPEQQPFSSPGSPSIDPSAPPSLDNAHFGHSLYFIEHLFPSKLWRILDDAERCGYANVISWVDMGFAFQIRKFIYLSICSIVDLYYCIVMCGMN